MRMASPAFANGRVIDGKYAIEETIAEGGIGVIVRATHTGLGQQVAIKYLKASALDDRALVERFEREGRLAARIASEHVVRVQDVGRLPGAGPYLVMEYLTGRDLGSIVDEGPLPVARAVDYILQACDALAEAHALRIVHRDIKPDNLFVAQRPSNSAILKIIDFGISKVAFENDPGGPRRRLATRDEVLRARETGHLEQFGTPLYMSPEQLRSAADVDQRTDIWSLGVVLFELLTGTVPFDGADVQALCENIQTAPAKPLRAVLPDAPVGIEAVITRCLQKDRAFRFRNVAELAQELAPYGPPESAARVSRIAQVVRRAGQSIRPATPMAFPVRGGMPVVTPSAPIVVDRDRETVVLRSASFPVWRVALAAFAGCVVVAASVVLLRARGATAVPSEPAAPAAVSTAPPPATTSAAIPSAAAETSAAASVVEQAPDAPPPAASHAPKPRPASKPASAADRRALFGDRK